jgi:hypothetical protein
MMTKITLFVQKIRCSFTHFEITLRVNQSDTANRDVKVAAEREDILSFLWELLIYIDTE